MLSSQAETPAVTAMVDVTIDTFEEVVLRDDGLPVLVDFWAPWCGPCKVMEPVLEALAREFFGRAVIARVNVDGQPALANATRIRAVPTLHLVHHGKLVDVMMGVQSVDRLRGALGGLTREG
jgi:thioredoxin